MLNHAGTGFPQWSRSPKAGRAALITVASLPEGPLDFLSFELPGVSEGTVKINVSAFMKSMGVSNRTEVALLASRKRRQ